MLSQPRLQKFLVVIAFIVFIIGFSSLYFPRDFVPIHDSRTTHQMIYVFYSHFVYFKTLPLWFPYGGYGAPSRLLQIQGLTPASYFVCLVSYFLQVKNTLLIFKFTYLLNVIIYLTGVTLLANLLYQRFVTKFFIVFTAFFSLAFWEH